jgi:hypothetical protein
MSNAITQMDIADPSLWDASFECVPAQLEQVFK